MYAHASENMSESLTNVGNVLKTRKIIGRNDTGHITVSFGRHCKVKQGGLVRMGCQILEFLADVFAIAIAPVRTEPYAVGHP